MSANDVRHGTIKAAQDIFWFNVGKEAERVAKLMKEDKKYLTRLTYFAVNGKQGTCDYDVAKRIMGNNFYGLDDAFDKLGVSITGVNIPEIKEIPWSAEFLLEHADTHRLVLTFPLSRIPEERRRLIARDEDVDEGTFNEVVKDETVLWSLITKGVVEGSANADILLQTSSNHIDFGSQVPSAQTVLYTCLIVPKDELKQDYENGIMVRTGTPYYPPKPDASNRGIIIKFNWYAPIKVTYGQIEKGAKQNNLFICSECKPELIV